MKQMVIGILVVFAALWVLVPRLLFSLDEREQAIITQFGAYIRTITGPRVARQASLRTDGAPFR